MQFLLDIWSAVIDEIGKKYSKTSMDLWFNELRLVFFDKETAVIVTKQKFKRDILESKYTKSIGECVAHVVGFNVKIIFIASEIKSVEQQLKELGFDQPDTAGSITEPKDSSSSDVKAESSDNSLPEQEMTHFLETDFREGINNISADYFSEEDKTSSPDKPKRETVARYNPGFTFGNFIVGDSNKFAHAACLAVANSFGSEKPDKPAGYFQKQYNPLFIHGPSGLGKTHLLYAVMNHIEKLNPSAKIVYVKGDDFTNQLIDSISHGKNEQFRNKYRKADILLIDDIQFIAGKTSTQEEFFHTFNALYEKNKQIILTADCPPKDISTLQDRLKTRFEWGLIADIQPPGFELRVAILKSKAEALRIDLPPDVIEFLAENLKNNVRQLEGAVKKLGARSLLTGAKITVDLTVSCVADLLTGSEPVSVTVDRILEKVSKKYGISVEDIKGRKRTKEVAFTRHVTIYIIRKLTNMSLPAIGKLLGRNHTTIISSLDTIEKEIGQNTLLEIEIGELIREIKE